MKVRTLLLLIAMVTFGFGCATTTPEFCKAETWHEIGYTDAIAGTTDTQTVSENSCSTKGAPIAYRLGFDYGLSEYCTFEKGLFSGEHGQAPAESCGDAKWDEYQNGYLTGHKIHLTNSRLEAISDSLVEYRTSLWRLASSDSEEHAHQINLLEVAILSLIAQRDSESRVLASLRANVSTQ